MTDIRSANDAVRVLWQQFDTIDGAKQGVNDVAAQAKQDALLEAIKQHQDGKISHEDLRAVAGDSRFSAEQREAAQYLLDNRDTLDAIDGADRGGDTDQIIGREAAVAFIGQHRDGLPYDVTAAADAADLLKVGARSGQTDDYDARLTAFADKLQGLPEADRGALMREVLRQDEGAPKSWLESSRLDKLKGDEITPEAHRTVSDAFAATPQGVKQFVEGTVTKDVDKYTKHAEELNWLIANEGPAMTPQQLQKAIDDFSKDKGPEWTGKLEEYQGKAAEHGREILQRLGQDDIGKLSPEEKQELLDTLGEDNPQAQTAVALALGENGGATQAEINEAMGFFDGVKVTGSSADFAGKLGQSYLSNVQKVIQEVDPNQPQTIRDAQAEIGKFRDSNYAKAMGLPADKFDSVLDTLARTLPESGNRISVTEMSNRLEAFGTQVDELSRTSTNAGAVQGIRLLGLSAGAIGMYQSGSELLADPDPEKAMRGLADLVGLSSGTTEALVSAGALAPESKLATTLGNPVLGKVLGGAGLVFGGVDLYRNIRDGDASQATLTGIGLAGAALATFGTTAWAGPVGVAVGALAAIGSIGLNQWRRVDASNEHMNSTSKEFLQHAGLKEDVAGALVDQSGEGHSPVPFLFEFAASRDLTPQQTVQWLNGLSKGDLESIRDRAHEALDKAGGDLNKFEGKTDQDKVDFLNSFARMREGGNPMVNDDGADFRVGRSSREVVAGTWDEFAALLQAKGRPLPSAG
ncbi:hypothetical protein [Pseudomonas sp. CGJS7]|uniref:hypothetical protein n=1 Tax=Pseudomonas sp. CGJS7 TaxID=3109348 RepID=UPI00300BF994